MTCMRCGRAGDPDPAAAMRWVCERDEQGARRWLCPGCARANVRDIEGKLPTEWWA